MGYGSQIIIQLFASRAQRRGDGGRAGGPAGGDRVGMADRRVACVTGGGQSGLWLAGGPALVALSLPSHALLPERTRTFQHPVPK